MHGEDRVTGEPFEQAFFQHFPGAAQPFFGRLENQLQSTLERPGLRQVPGGRQQGGRMTVMAASMHDAVDPAGVG
ncbi:hypothetical protein D3C86_1218170 [compost metagenome]